MKSKKFIKYGRKIKILQGLFEKCHGIFFQYCDRKVLNKEAGLIEVFFREPFKSKKGEDYFVDMDTTKKRKMCSAMIRIPLEYIEILEEKLK